MPSQAGARAGFCTGCEGPVAAATCSASLPALQESGATGHCFVPVPPAPEPEVPIRGRLREQRPWGPGHNTRHSDTHTRQPLAPCLPVFTGITRSKLSGCPRASDCSGRLLKRGFRKGTASTTGLAASPTGLAARPHHPALCRSLLSVVGAAHHHTTWPLPFWCSQRVKPTCKQTERKKV